MRVTLALIILLLSIPAVGEEVLWRGLGPEPGSLDPQQAQGLAALNVIRDLNEGLVTLDAAARIQPGLASHWVVEDDGRRYIFYLRPGLTWNNGQALSASDFVRGLRYAVDPANSAPFASLLDPIRNAVAIRRGELPVTSLGIRVINAQRLAIELNHPSPVLLDVLSHPVSYPRHQGKHQDSISNGPFMLNRWEPQSLLELVKNPRYHSANQVALDRVQWWVTEDQSSELSRYRAGELHITETIPAGRFHWLRENMGEHLHVSSYLGTFYLAFNLTRPPFSGDVKIRQALNLAVDRDTLVRVVTGAGEKPAFGLVAEGLEKYSYPQFAAPIMDQEERMALARALYRQAGFSKENPLRITLRYNTSTAQRRLAAAVSAMWRQYLGVITELYNEEWKVFLHNRKNKVNTQVVRGGWIADMADPISFLEPFLSDSSLNYTGYNDAVFDQLLVNANAAPTEQIRMDYLGRAEAHLLDDQPIIPLYYYVSRHLVNPRVKGFIDNVMDIHLSRYLSLAGQQ